MITKKEFCSLIIDNMKYNDQIDDISKSLQSDIFDTDWANYGNVVFEMYLRSLFNVDGIDLILWWMFEKDITIYNENNIQTPIETIEDLWEVVKEMQL